MGGIVETVLEHSSPLNLAVALVAVLAIIWNTKWLAEEIKVRRLGGHTRRAQTYLPFRKSLSMLFMLWLNLLTLEQNSI
jgi:hypothetical protein